MIHDSAMGYRRGSWQACGLPGLEMSEKGSMGEAMGQ